MARFTPPTTASELFAFCKREKVEMVDIKFADVEGRWSSVTMTMDSFTPDSFKKGIAFDGSSIPGFQTIVESDLVLMPVPETAFIDPASETKTLSIVGEPMDPAKGTLVEYENNPRFVARKALEYLKASKIGDTMYVGPEIEFFIFDDVRYTSTDRTSGYEIDSDEAAWNNGEKFDTGNHGVRAANQKGYFTIPPMDMYREMRNEMVRELQNAGIIVERHHHEVGAPGQAEINIRYQDMLRQADQVLMYKYIVRVVAARYGKTVTYMPKPLFGHNGSGMHCHQSLWKGGKPLFYDAKGYARLSPLALHYIGGILKHAPALMAFGAPGTNSYKRLTPGYEAPTVLAYSKRNRSAAIRIPVYDQTPAGTRIEFRSSDAMANPYLWFSAMLMAGLDGIKNKIKPGDSFDKNLFHLTEAEQKKVKFVPSSLDGSFEALEKDHDFLLKGGVFTEAYLENYTSMKRQQMDAVRLRPHPHEFSLYFNS